MKKKIITIVLCITLLSTLLIGCDNSSKDTNADETSGDTVQEQDTGDADDTEDDAEGDDSANGIEGKKIAIVVKSAGNPFNTRQASGFKEVVEAAGATCIIKEPEKASAEHQIAMINELVAQQVDVIAIAGNDPDALQPALQAAMNAGIQVLSFDSSVNASSRVVHVNQAGTDLIGTTLMEAILDITGGEGQFAILSATSQATNQNSWIEAMQKEMDSNDKYANLELVEIAYGDDEYQKSVDQTQALLSNYPDLKLICAPTTVGIMAAAKVLQDQGVADTVKLTGLGLPSEMADYIGTDDDKSTPYMYLWNPIHIGELAAHTAIALVTEEITGAEGDTFTAGDLGEYTIEAAADDGTEVILGPPFEFNPENIDEWKEVY